jgi:hypothetical protein
MRLRELSAARLSRRGVGGVMVKLAALSALAALALCGARADVLAQRAVSGDSALRGRPLADTRIARGSRPPKRAIGAPRGAPPGPGYCWYYIDRSTGAPGFWDLCRGR